MLRPDNTPAFPSVPPGFTHYPGMMLRDYFAIAFAKELLKRSDQAAFDALIPERAYHLADDMLKRRAK